MPMTRSGRLAAAAAPTTPVTSKKSDAVEVEKKDSKATKATRTRSSSRKANLKDASKHVEQSTPLTIPAVNVKIKRTTQAQNTPKLPKAVLPTSRRENENEHVTNSWTPVTEKRKAATAAASTTTNETFPGRLDWKSKFFGIPTTSTPKQTDKELPVKIGAAITQKDIKTCFGFDESDEDENYADMISPIAFIPKPRRYPVHVQFNPPTVNQNPQQLVLQENNSKEMPKINSPIEHDNKIEITDSIEVKPTDVKKSKLLKAKRSKLKLPKVEIKKSKTDQKLIKTRPKKIDHNLYLYDLDDVQSSQTLAEDAARGNPNEPGQENSFVKNTSDDEEFNALLFRYGKGHEQEVDEIPFDSAKIKRTYVSTKKWQNEGRVNKKQTSAQRKSKKFATSHASKKPSKPESESDESVLEPEIKRWLELKNKEFEDVSQVRLFINEKSN